MNVTAVFDIGRTNKKCALFDEQNNLVEEFSDVLPETVDEDGFPCEDVALLTSWVKKHWTDLKKKKKSTRSGRSMYLPTGPASCIWMPTTRSLRRFIRT